MVAIHNSTSIFDVLDAINDNKVVLLIDNNKKVYTFNKKEVIDQDTNTIVKLYFLCVRDNQFYQIIGTCYNPESTKDQ